MDAVLFDWRGALLDTLRPVTAELDAPGMDADPRLHARVYREVLSEAGVDANLVGAL